MFRSRSSAPLVLTMMGYEQLGSGATAVIVLNDWLCDTSTWDGARPYLDQTHFTWIFADLRGYGRSKGRGGMFTVEEAAADVIDVADALGGKKIAIVGHSMSALVALHLAQHHADRIDRAVVLTPPPPTGLGVDDATLEYLRSMARADDATRTSGMRRSAGDRLSAQWITLKMARWRASADPEAAAAYVAMFARRGLPEPKAMVAVPLLAVTGERDAEVMRRDAVTKFLAPLCAQLEVTALADCGHYPMQEAPPLLVTIVERFLAAGGVGAPT